jgi:glycosyltransferase involved in cell wall biosynthesis
MNQSKVIGVLLTYKQAHLIEQTYQKLPKELFDEIIIADDDSGDGTDLVAKKLGLTLLTAPRTGYGGNLKRAFKYALDRSADYIVEIHGDGQYGPEMIQPGLEKIKSGYDFVMGSRFTNLLQPLRDKMSLARWLANIGLSFTERLILQLPLTEFHGGFRVYSKRLLTTVNLEPAANDFLFSFEIIVLAKYYNLKVGDRY